MIRGAERGSVRSGCRFCGAAGGGGPGEAELRLRQTASVSGRGRQRRNDPARPGKMKLGAFPQPRRSPFPPAWGFRCFSGSFTAPAGRRGPQRGWGRVPAAAGAAWTGGCGFPGTGEGWVSRLRPASRETAAELRGTRYGIVEDGRLLGASPPVFTADLGTRDRCAPSLSVGHPRHQVLPTPR